MQLEAAEAQELPLLRYRVENRDLYFEKPVTIVGTISRVHDEEIEIAQGREQSVNLYVEDFEDLLGNGDPELALSILLDAAEHGDVVKIQLTQDRLSYDNEKQLERAGI